MYIVLVDDENNNYNGDGGVEDDGYNEYDDNCDAEHGPRDKYGDDVDVDDDDDDDDEDVA